MTAPSSSLSLLVGRDRELGILRERLEATCAGHGGLVLIGGEAGIGKTALAEAMCRDEYAIAPMWRQRLAAMLVHDGTLD